MRFVAIYRPNSEFARTVEEFVHNFEERSGGVKAEVVDFDSKEGQSKCGVYGIMQHPTLLALRDDGELLKVWEGSQMPLIDEVLAYLR
jgi:hypothetical protein